MSLYKKEVGLDTHARKNRSGDIMQNYLAKIFKENNLNFIPEIYSDQIDGFGNLFGTDIKRFDFVIFGKNKTYLLEVNFYSVQGSKPNEVDRAYIHLADKLSKSSKFDFIWITDGDGQKSSKNKLEEAYKSVEIYNLSNLQNFINKVKNDR